MPQLLFTNVNVILVGDTLDNMTAFIGDAPAQGKAMRRPRVRKRPIAV